MRGCTQRIDLCNGEKADKDEKTVEKEEMIEPDTIGAAQHDEARVPRALHGPRMPSKREVE